MFGPRRQVGEVMLAQRLGLILVVQHARPFHDEINLLLSLVGDGLAIAIPIQRNFAETRDGLKSSVVFISLAENGAIVAGGRSEIRLSLGDVGSVAMQPRRVCLMFLRSESL